MDIEIQGLTVEQLIEKLKNMPQNAEVILQGRYHYNPLKFISKREEFNQIILNFQ